VSVLTNENHKLLDSTKNRHLTEGLDKSRRGQEASERLSTKQSHNQNTRWIHSIVHMPNLNKIAMSSDDHEISFYGRSLLIHGLSPILW
jgi:transposase